MSLQELVINEPMSFVRRGGFPSVHLLEHTENEMRAHGFSPARLKAAVFSNRTFVDYVKARFSLETDQDVDEYIAFLQENRSHVYASLSLAAIKFFCKTVLLRNSERNASQNHELPSVLSREEVARLLSSVSTIKHRLLLEFLYGCGLLISEAVSLKIQDIDLSGGLIHVGGENDRMLPLPLKIIPKMEFFLRHSVNPGNPYVFQASRSTGSHMSTEAAQAAISQAARKAGLQKSVSGCTLRHSYATYLLEHGVDIKLIQQLLGQNADSGKYLHSVPNPLDTLKS